MSADGWSAVANVVLAISAGFGAYTAWKGLNAWKDQQRWQLDHDLARRALMQVYQYRDALYDVRHPVMFPEEMAPDPEEEETGFAGYERYTNRFRAYKRRWQRHTDIDAELRSIVIEADAVWGPKLNELIQPLKSIRNELFSYILTFLDSFKPNLTDEAILMYRDLLKENSYLLYDRLDDDDLFRKDFSTKLLNVEAYLREKLDRR